MTLGTKESVTGVQPMQLSPVTQPTQPKQTQAPTPPKPPQMQNARFTTKETKANAKKGTHNAPSPQMGPLTIGGDNKPKPENQMVEHIKTVTEKVTLANRPRRKVTLGSKSKQILKEEQEKKRKAAMERRQKAAQAKKPKRQRRNYKTTTRSPRPGNQKPRAKTSRRPNTRQEKR